MHQFLREHVKSLGILFLMTISGAICFIVTAFIFFTLGTLLHGNYEYYGLRYPALVFAPAVVGFFAPLLILWRAGKVAKQGIFRTILIAVVVLLALELLYCYGVLWGICPG